MAAAMQNIKEMVDVNTIVGDAVEAPDGTVIIPISKVSFGFVAGGGEVSAVCGRDSRDDEEEDGAKLPFAGGSGGGFSINPVAFMVVGKEQIRLLPVDMNISVDRILDIVPGLFDKFNECVRKKTTSKEKTTSKD